MYKAGLPLSRRVPTLRLGWSASRPKSSKAIPNSIAAKKTPINSKDGSWRSFFINLGSNESQKKLTKVYVAGFGVCVVFFYYYMRDKYFEEQYSNSLKQKFLQNPDALNEYEHLRLKAILGDQLKVREQKTYDLYQEVRKEYFRANPLKTKTYLPSEADLQEWYSRQAKRAQAPAKHSHDHGDDDEAKSTGELTGNKANPNIMEACDTTEFYEAKAAEYDDEVKWEERAILMGMRRSQIMAKLEGDVLEVSCGTGRNIPYLKFDNIDSITFLDSSAKMVEITRDKFREEYPKFGKAAFTVGKAEDLLQLTGGSDQIKYDTIVETFGLCSHEDPVVALQNMAQLLRPGGRIVLLEHGRSTWDFINNHLDFRAERRMQTWACRWNLDIGELVEDAGLDVTFEKRVHFGTTWMLVLKKPDDPIKSSEKPFFQKLLGIGPKAV